MVDIDKVSDFFICFAHKQGDLITNLKLQALLYYAQAWHLALNNREPLFDGYFQAGTWVPVEKSQYRRFEKNKVNDIVDSTIKEPDIERKIVSFLINIYQAYGKYEIGELGNIDNCNKRITNESMYRFYSCKMRNKILDKLENRCKN